MSAIFENPFWLKLARLLGMAEAKLWFIRYLCIGSLKFSCLSILKLCLLTQKTLALVTLHIIIDGYESTSGSISLKMTSSIELVMSIWSMSTLTFSIRSFHHAGIQMVMRHILLVFGYYRFAKNICIHLSALPCCS